MKFLINAIENSLRSKNYYGALFLTLMAPDICGYAQDPKIDSSKRYVDWFNTYLSKKYQHRIGANHKEHIFLSGEDCYALRCSLLHEGRSGVSHQRIRQALDDFTFVVSVKNYMHCNYSSKSGHNALQLDVETFCKDMLDGVRKWHQDVRTNSGVAQRLSEMITIQVV